MKINKYFWVVFIYFFINPFGLPWGLTYTTLLTPLLYGWVVATRRKEILLPFIIAMAPFIVIQLINQVVLSKYLISLANMAAVYVFCQAIYTFLLCCHDKEKIFRRILAWNFVFCLLAIPFYFYSPAKDFIWISQEFTSGVRHFKRLKGFTYEASYYATVFTPFFLFFFFQLLLKRNKIKTGLLLAMLAIPYAFSLSFGVMAALLLSIGICCGAYLRHLVSSSRVLQVLIAVPVVVLGGLLLGEMFFPENAIFLRITNVFQGNDISKNARTSDAFMLATKILDKRNPWWGIGPGQLKVLGTDLIMNYYGYGKSFDKSLISIPNTTAETLVTFGWIGLCIRLLAEIILLYLTKAWRNYYQLTLFCFIFIYQFTGSFLTSTAEYAVWILAFTHAFPQFDVPQDRRKPVRQTVPVVTSLS